MTESNDQDRKAPLKLSPGKLELKKTVETGQVRQSFSHGRSKVVQVEVVRRPRAPVARDPSAADAAPPAPAGAVPPPREPVAPSHPAPGAGQALAATELATRQRALQELQRDAARREAERREQETISIFSAAEEARRREAEARASVEPSGSQAAEPAASLAKRLTAGQLTHETKRAAKAGMTLTHGFPARRASKKRTPRPIRPASPPCLSMTTPRQREALSGYETRSGPINMWKKSPA